MRSITAIAILAFSTSLALAQTPSAEQFNAYRQSVARDIGNAVDGKAICEAGAATLTQQNQQLQKQVADLKADLAKAKTPSVPNAPKPEHNPPSP